MNHYIFGLCGAVALALALAGCHPGESTSSDLTPIDFTMNNYNPIPVAERKQKLTPSQTIITELVKAIIRQVELPLEVAKLEGDAVFLFCRKRAGSQPWPDTQKTIGDKLIAFFRTFSEKVTELSQSTTCTCNACTHIEKLRLKVVVHSGEALFHRVFNFAELAGMDVIIVHRLLKNSVAADQYLLLTEAARHDVEFSKPINLTASCENYDDIGMLNTLVFSPEAESTSVDSPAASSFGSRFSRSWKLFCKLWFAPFASSSNGFRHVESNATKSGRIGFATLTMLLTPLFIPVGSMFVLFHVFKSPAAIQHVGRHDGERQHGHRRQHNSQQRQPHAHDGHRTDGDDDDDDGRGNGDGRVERDEFLREIHQRIRAGEGAQHQQQHPAVEFLDVKRVGDQAQQKAEYHHAGRAEPGEFAQPSLACKAVHWSKFTWPAANWLDLRNQLWATAIGDRGFSWFHFHRDNIGNQFDDALREENIETLWMAELVHHTGNHGQELRGQMVVRLRASSADNEARLVLRWLDSRPRPRG